MFVAVPCTSKQQHHLNKILSILCLFVWEYRNNCINCHTQFGEYHYEEQCNLWMSIDENLYHCSDCGFCRIAGDDAFVYCHDCAMCVYASQFERHDCKKGKYKSNCLICQECMFDSRKKTHETLPCCGHAIHHCLDCFLQLTKHDLRYPLCKKTTESQKKNDTHMEVDGNEYCFNPIPCEMAKGVDIYCNACEMPHQSNRLWHPDGIQCQSCFSFNIFIETLTATGLTANTFLQNQESM
jgi:hypothetical protein